MSQDIISDALNQIMNAKRARKESVVVNRFSKLLLDVLEIGKKGGYIGGYNTEGTKLEITFGELNECGSIKPRYNVSLDKITQYVRRYLPARDMGVMIVSTSKGVMTSDEMIKNKIGGCLIAYFY